ncbi:6,7-dimethyl-8-ribityllumazine synthase [Synechococcus sp. CC9902]|uniref:6,7-dimethyl-8-ribityllumazine synthase n=1 Tax=Synechococcus sp. (strain CC9902) TaxID=316279 RepID=RISB_SYNS9|nr:6,7-dimethyl-8-ribityllumazine synthase [Synechococcus sp. CC9902]Q3B0Q0.1 RecName: Full=6,7-dimethyl-8-ribityllumazine synthase; Short=DMRL synthase; Short=LS; Short=Lumazine synthase [Synechococcus sp. CC9902]ABB25078.1 6,7-dimethyl-8-ribityllumazine synthase [Synechococcus sp. CC9902]
MTVFEGNFENSKDLNIGIVVSRFNDLITNKLLSGCIDCLKRHGVNVETNENKVDIAWVPGAYELPLITQLMARTKKYDVIITLGAVIRGDTPHFDVVISEASKGIASVTRDTSIPIIFGVLTTDTMQQALERAGIKNNLGWGYALQALEMGSLVNAMKISKV